MRADGLYLRAGASADDLAQLKRFDGQMDSFAAARDAKGRKAFAEKRTPNFTGK